MTRFTRYFIHNKNTLLFLMVTVLLQCRLASADSRPLAVLNGQTLTVSDYVSFVMISEPKNDPLAVTEDMLKRMLEETVILQEAVKGGIIVPEDEVENAVKDSLASKGISPITLGRELKELGLDFGDYRKSFAKRMLATRYLEEELFSAVTVSEDDVRDYYSVNRDTFMQSPEMLDVRGIFLRTGTETERTESDAMRDKATKIYAELKNGKSFEKVAALYNEDLLKNEGGRMGSFRKGELLPEFDAALAKMGDGEVSQPIGTADGYYILKLVKRTPEKFTPLEEVREKIRAVLIQKRRLGKYDVWMRSLLEKSEIRINQIIERSEPSGNAKALTQTDLNKLEADLSDAMKRAGEAEAAAEKISDDYGELVRSYEALAQQYENNIAELRAFKDRLARYDKPVVRIAGKNWSLFQIIEENLVASRVLSRLNVSSVPWKTGELIEEFVAGQVLYSKIGEETIRARNASAEVRSANYSFNEREREFFVKYLLLSDIIEKVTAEPVIAEDEIKKYYEDHRKEYLISGKQRIIKYFIVPFTEADEKKMTELADSILKDVVAGKSFENIYRLLSDTIEFRQDVPADLPGMIEETADEMSEGETKKVISEGRYYVLQAQSSAPVYKPFWEVREEIREKFASERRVPLQFWLREIAREAEEIRG